MTVAVALLAEIIEIMLTSQLLAQINNLIASKLGRHFSPECRHDIERIIGQIAREFGLPDVASGMRWLLNLRPEQLQMQILTRHFTVGETYFFRDDKAFAAIEHLICPQLVAAVQKRQRQISIWCAGCSSGEEPYSLAILFERMLSAADRKRFRIYATDINHHLLEQAQAGFFKEWSFRATPDWIKQKYFRKNDQSLYQISSSIKARVKFSYLNLIENTYPNLFNHTSDIDLLLCRNVLMYMSPEQQQRIVAAFYRCLNHGGWLLVSPVETSGPAFSAFASIYFRDSIIYRKPANEEWQPQVFPTNLENATLSLEPPPLANAVRNNSDDHDPGPNAKTTATTPVQDSDSDDYNTALVHYRRGDYAQARSILERLYQRSSQTEFLPWLIKSCANLGRFAEAIQWCQSAIASAKLDPLPYYFQAMILQTIGQLDAAANSLRQVLYLDRNFVMAYFMLASIRHQQDRSQDAARCWNNTLGILSQYQDQQPIPHGEGLTASSLKALIAKLQTCGEMTDVPC